MKMGQQTGSVYSLDQRGMANVNGPFIPRSLREPVVLEDGEVHVWSATLQSTPEVILDLWRTLAADEKQRALRFQFQRDCDRYIVARGLLRAILGNYLGRSPDNIEFSYNDFGKPGISQSSGHDSLEFNLSHADTMALFAVTRGRKVGVDIERLRADIANETVAEEFFSAREQDDLRTLSPEDWQRGFFTCWTRKEAFVKAHGNGLSLPLDQFDVSVIPEESAALLTVRDGVTEASQWSLKEITINAEYVGALAVEGHDWQLLCWQLATTNSGRL